MAIIKEKVTWIHHWSKKMFSFKTTRSPSLRFNSGEFALMGILIDDKPKLKAYSISSANHEDYLEWLSIKLDNGPLTSKLQHIKVGDEILVNSKSTGTLVIDYLLPGRNLYLISTGTGLSPFMAIIKDPRTYEKFEKVILTHTVQYPEELAYKDVLESFNKEWDMITEGNFIYFNTLTKSPWEREGRITNWIKDSSLFKHTTKQDLDINLDRFMICGSEGLNKDLMNYFKGIGMKEGNTQIAGTYLVEKAFVE